MPKPPVEHQFKPGQSGNPGGVSRVDRELKRLSKEEFSEVVSLLLRGSTQELRALVASPDTPAFKKWIANVAILGIQKGDMSTLDSLLNRLLGKVKEEMEVTMPTPTIIEYENSRLVLTSKLEKEK